jgi:hypothetical protein
MTVNFRKIAVGTLTALAMLAVSPPAYSETQTGIVNVEVAVVCRDPRDLALLVISFPLLNMNQLNQFDPEDGLSPCWFERNLKVTREKTGEVQLHQGAVSFDAYCLSPTTEGYLWTHPHFLVPKQKCMWTMYGLINIVDGPKTISPITAKLPPPDINAPTGWVQGPDGKWRVERK